MLLKVHLYIEPFFAFTTPHGSALFQMSSIVMPGMVEKKRGVVINIASAAGNMPVPLLTVYSACKVSVSTEDQVQNTCPTVLF